MAMLLTTTTILPAVFNLSTVITMASIGVGATVAEKILQSLGKPDLAQFCSIAGFSLLGLSAITVVCELIKTLGTLG